MYGVKYMIVKLANCIIEIKSRYKYTFDMCSDYLYNGDKKVDFTVFATDEQLKEEAEKSSGFTIDVIENTCIYKNICTEILKYDALFIHSAAISVDNEAYLFSANSGTGKTTHMNLWLDKFGERAFIINGDKPILRCIDDKIYVFGTPWCGKEGYNKNVCVPLKGICVLEQAKENSIVKMDSKSSLMFLLTQTIHPKTSVYTNLMLDNLGKVIDSTPVYKLSCNMEPEACEICYEAMK